MFRKIVFCFLILSSFIASTTFGQSREMGIMLGVMNYKGDLQKATYAGQNNLPGIGFLYRRSYSNHWAFKAAISYGNVQGDDAQSDDPFNKNRNLNFKSSILEGTGQFEFNFFPYQTSNPSTSFTPYMSVGLSVFKFNPKAYYNGDYIELQPLGTEGQGTNANPDKGLYKKTSLAFVFGGGFKWKIGRRWSVVLESVVRKTYTDYLDDVSGVYADPNAIRVEYGKTAYFLSDRSIVKNNTGNIGRQRGDNTNRDWYHFTGVQFTYTLSKHYIDQCRPFRIKLW
jgi:hypothetical protein